MMSFQADLISLHLNFSYPGCTWFFLVYRSVTYSQTGIEYVWHVNAQMCMCSERQTPTHCQ